MARYDLTDFEWPFIEPILPRKSRGVPPAGTLNGIVWALRSGAPSQRRLAAIADVSTPTVSRFESGDKNIQLASSLAILEALGMVEHSPIDFPEKIRAVR